MLWYAIQLSRQRRYLCAVNLLGMKEFWNNRYAQEISSYGLLPNRFFKQELDKLTPGSILLAAEGEGRNAVYAASKNWEVEAFDFSESVQHKALRLAETQGVPITYDVIDAREFISDRQFDLLALIYAHFPSEIRKGVHRQLLGFVKPGGLVVFEAFSKEQLGKDSGGPKNHEMLFPLDEIRSEFENLDFKLLEEVQIQLNEGVYHNGKASVIRFVGKRSV